MAKKETVEKQAEQPKAVKQLLDESKEYTIVGTGKRSDIVKDVEYLVGGQVASLLIERGFAKLK